MSSIDEIESLVVFGELVDLADVRMVEAGGGAGFAKKPFVQ